TLRYLHAPNESSDPGSQLVDAAAPVDLSGVATLPRESLIGRRSRQLHHSAPSSPLPACRSFRLKSHLTEASQNE
ncbi:hypothetical protein SK128_018125, partial [Halocaridina rubra]